MVTALDKKVLDCERFFVDNYFIFAIGDMGFGLVCGSIFYFFELIIGRTTPFGFP
jgi:hypothetical protein